MAEIQAYVDQVIKTLLSKEDIMREKWSKPFDEISGFGSTQIRKERGRKQF